MAKIVYTNHLRTRLKLRQFPEDLPRITFFKSPTGFISPLPISVLTADKQMSAKKPEMSAVSPTAEPAQDGLLP